MMAACPLLLPPPLDDRTSCPMLSVVEEYFEMEPMFQKMASCFFTASNKRLIGPKLSRVITDQRKFVLFRTLCSRGRLVPSEEEIQAVYAQYMATIYQLLVRPSSKPTAEGLTPEQDSVRLALFLVTQPALSVSQPTSAFSRSIAKQLRSALEHTEMSKLWESSSSLLLWILYMLAHISYGEDQWPWIITHVAMLTKAMDIGSRKQMQEVLSGFYFFPDPSVTTLQKVWSDVQIVLQAPYI